MREHISVKVLVLGCLSLAGCSCGDAPDGANFTFTSDGTGPEGKNLSASRVGQVESGYGFVVDGATDQKAGRALRTHNFHNETYQTLISTKAGLFLTGTSRDGVLEHPRLVVPTVVRVGMKWEIPGSSGKPEFVYEVTARDEGTATFFGPATVWTIRQNLSNGFVDRTYAEGFGRVNGPPDLWPIEDQVLDAPTPQPVSLEELALPDTLKFTQNAPWIDAVSMARPDPGQPSMLLVSGSFDPGTYAIDAAPGTCVKLEAGQVTALPPTLGRPFRRTRGLECPSANYCVRVPGVGTQGAICPEVVLHANGALVADDGTVTWIARKWNGQFVAAGAAGFGPEDSVVKAGGGLYAAFPMTGVDGGGDGLSLGVDTARVGLPSQFGEPFSFDPAAYRALEHSFPYSPRDRLPQYTEMLDFGADAQGRRQVLMRDAESVVFWSRLEGNRFSHPRVGGRISGRLSVQAQRGGADVLRVTSNGSVDRLVLSGDELKLQHLADVPLPKTHVGIGAFVDGDRLLVATIANGVPDAFGETVSLHLFRSAPFSGSQVLRIPQALTVYVRALSSLLGATNAVCWRSTGEATDVSSWTISGLAPDLAVAAHPGDDCVLVGVDARQGATPKLEQLSGVIPGVGKIFIRGKPSNGSTDVSDQLNPGVPTAVLRDGSFITTRRRYSRGGLDLGLPDRLGANWDSLGTGLVADHGGAGLWVRDRLADGGYRLELKGDVTTLLPGVEAERPAHALLPTGLATESGLFVLPDGGTRSPPTGNAVAWCHVMADGSLCGVTGTSPGELVCTSPAGVQRSVANPERAGGDCAEWLPRGDGTFVLPSFGKVWAFDPAAMTLSLEDSWFWLGTGVDFKGRGLIAKRVWGTPRSTIHLVSKGFPEAFAVPDWVWTYGGLTPNSFKLISTPDLTLLVLTWTGTFGTTAPTAFRLPPTP